MGKTYTNFHIKKNDSYSYEHVRDSLIAYMKKNGAEPIDKDDANLVVVAYSPDNSEWISIAVEGFELNDYKSIYSNARALSNLFGSDAITAACCDSDWGYISLVNAVTKEQAWINIGTTYTGRKLHRSSLGAWKKRVSDFASFKEAVNKERLLAEKTFEEIAPMINMDITQTDFDVNSLEQPQVQKLYFKANDIVKRAAVKFKLSQPSLMPCQMDKSSAIIAYNVGESSKGLGIMFSGDWVQEDEIKIKDVSVGSNICDYDNRQIVPIELKKIETGDGKSALYWEDKNFVIPKGVPVGLPETRRAELISQKEFGVWFTPYGNSRKALDIMVSFIPLNNRKDGCVTWYCYSGYNSKEDYINNNNRNINSIRGKNSLFDALLINKEDYDV